MPSLESAARFRTSRWWISTPLSAPGGGRVLDQNGASIAPPEASEAAFALRELADSIRECKSLRARGIGQLEPSRSEFEKGARLNNDSDALAVTEVAKREYAKSGYRGALKRFAALEEEQARRIYIDPAWIASRHAELGEKDLAFTWLEKAYAEKSGFLLYIKVLPRFDSLRSDPRYAELLKRMGLPQS